MKKYIIAGVIVVVGVAAAIAVYQYQKPSAKVVTEDAAFELTATELFDEFETDEEKANSKYLNKVVGVTGVISEFTKGDNDGASIVLETESPFGIMCQVNDGNKYDNLKVGDYVVVKGICTGKLMDVVLVRCSIDKTSVISDNQE